MKLERPFIVARRWVRGHQRVTLVVLVALVGVVLSLAFVADLSSGPVSVEAGVLPQEPTFQGQNIPNIYFKIAYSGVGFGNFSYVVRYNATGGSTYADSGNVLVRTGTPYTYYLYVAPTPGKVSVVVIEVFRGSSASLANLVFNKTLAV